MDPKTITVTLATAEDRARFGGDTITLSLAPSDVTTQQEIDTYLPGYQPFAGFRADQIAGPTPLVDKDSDTYRIFGSNNVFRRINVKSSRTAPVGEVDPETSLGTYNALIYATGSFLPAATEAQSKYDLKQAAARVIADKLLLDRECRFWAFITTVANWNSNQVKTLGSGFNWNGGASALPIVDLQTMCRASSQVVTGIYMPLEGAHSFLNNDSVKDYLRMMLGDNAPSPQLVNAAGPQGMTQDVELVVPGLPPIHVAGAKVLNESTGNLDEIIGRTNVVGVCQPPISSVQFDSIQTVRTFRTKGLSGTGYTSREYPVPHRGHEGGTMLVAGFTEDIRMVANSAGFYLRSVLV